jgi:hypothetical protein
MRPPSIFLSHNHRDKSFVRVLAQDLSAMGIRVWLDEAELKVGDSLITKVSEAIDEMTYLGVVLSPNSVNSRWVKEELNQALVRQLSERDASVLPIMLADCQVPGFLRDRLYADFRDPGDYDNALRRLLTSIGIDLSKGQMATITDPFATRLSRVSRIYARPKAWYCIICGWHCDGLNNDYLCMGCGTVRPFAGDSATLVICAECGEGSLGIASFCEWCGTNIRRAPGQSITYRCPYESARVVACLRSSGDHINAFASVLTLNINGRELTSGVSVNAVIEEIYVNAEQTVFRGTPLYRVVRLG